MTRNWKNDKGNGGDGGTRTPGPLNAIEVLSQLSYIPPTWHYSRACKMAAMGLTSFPR